MTATYAVNSWAVCVSGFERLRNRDEFMITVPVSRETTVEELRSDMKADIQSYMQPEWFDFDACRAAIDAFCGELPADIFADLEENEEGEEGCYLFVYMQAPCEVPVY